MCNVKCQVLEGLIDTEKVVRIPTVEGYLEEVTVSSQDVVDHTLVAGFIGEREGKVLIELPRESASGRWRLWVPADQVLA